MRRAEDDIERVLLSEEVILEKVHEVGKKISEDFGLWKDSLVKMIGIYGSKLLIYYQI